MNVFKRQLSGFENFDEKLKNKIMLSKLKQDLFDIFCDLLN
jgi:hypothetical protein